MRVLLDIDDEKAGMLEELKDSIEELNDIKQGKKKGHTIQDLLDEINS